MLIEQHIVNANYVYGVLLGACPNKKDVKKVLLYISAVQPFSYLFTHIILQTQLSDF